MARGKDLKVVVTCSPSNPGVPGGPTSPFFPWGRKKKRKLGGRETAPGARLTTCLGGNFSLHLSKPLVSSLLPTRTPSREAVWGRRETQAVGSGRSWLCNSDDSGNTWPQMQKVQKGEPEKNLLLPQCSAWRTQSPSLEVTNLAKYWLICLCVGMHTYAHTCPCMHTPVLPSFRTSRAFSTC